MPVVVMDNKWVEKAWKDPRKFRAQVKMADDSTPHVVKKANDKELKITYDRANRTKTLRGIRKS